MGNRNDEMLNLIATGDTLQLLHDMRALDDAAKDPLALNRALYAPRGEADAEHLRALDQKYRAELGSYAGVAREVTLYNLGCMALAQDDIMEARMRFGEVLERNPAHIMARHNMAYAHELLAETEEARVTYEAVLAQNPNCALSRLNRAQVLAQEGDAAAALTEMDALHSRNPSNMGVLLYLVRGLLQRGEAEDLERALELLEQTPDALSFAELQECRAYVLVQQNQLDEAHEAFSALLAADPDSVFALTGMLKVLSQRNDYEAMREYTQRLQAVQPSEHLPALLEDLNEA